MIKKRGGVDMSFGMIFSIFLIVIFLAFGFYGIKTFLKMQTDTQLKMFVEDLKKDVTTSWQSEANNDWIREYTLPSYIKQVCFQDNEFGNLKFRADKSSSKDGSLKMIEHLNIQKMMEVENPFCIDNIKGKVRLIISLEEGDSLITIKK